MKKTVFAIFLTILLVAAVTVRAQVEPFTYQGSLKLSGAPANGVFDFRFSACTAPTGANCTDLGTYPAVTVANGIFTVRIANFTTVFNTSPLYLETAVKTAAEANYTTLAPRQEFTKAPLAIRSLSADNAQSLGGLAAGQYLTTAAAQTGLIANGTSAQTANFNISGTGTANLFRASQYNIGGERVVYGSFGNLFLGIQAGVNMTNDSTNTANTFVGALAGQLSTVGGANVSIGWQTGAHNGGDDNTFVGAAAGTTNTTGKYNTFLGRQSGAINLNGNYNSAAGWYSLFNNTSGVENSVLGQQAGYNNTTGSYNTFVGSNAGLSNTTNFYNSTFGFRADVAAGVGNSTAIGANSKVTVSNALVLGAVPGVNGAGSATYVGIGTTAPTAPLHVVGNTFLNGSVFIGPSVNNYRLEVNDSANKGFRVQTNTAGGTVASFGGNGAFQIDSPGTAGGRLTVQENGSVGINTNTPDANSKLQVNGNVRVTNGYVFVTNPNTVIITSPNGACWGITVNNSGQLATFPVNPCP
ncbi:MAG: hypothetical protein JSS81_25100 [Acidobacteria bacterium]|nr:hypothetical protein [Acidobacteriota bacterium]